MCTKNTAYLPLESLPHQGQVGGGAVRITGRKSPIQTIQKEKIFENGGQMDDDGQVDDGPSLSCISSTL